MRLLIYRNVTQCFSCLIKIVPLFLLGIITLAKAQDSVVIDTTRWYDYHYQSASKANFKALIDSSTNGLLEDALVYEIRGLVGITNVTSSHHSFAYIEFDEVDVDIHQNNTPTAISISLHNIFASPILVAIEDHTIRAFVDIKNSNETTKRLMQTVLGNLNFTGLFSSWDNHEQSLFEVDVNGVYVAHYMPSDVGYNKKRDGYLPQAKQQRVIRPDISGSGSASVFLDRHNRVEELSGYTNKVVKLKQRTLAASHEKIFLKLLFEDVQANELLYGLKAFHESPMVSLDSRLDRISIRKQIARYVLKDINRRYLLNEFTVLVQAGDVIEIEKRVQQLSALVILESNSVVPVCKGVKSLTYIDTIVSHISIAIVESGNQLGIECLVNWLVNENTDSEVQNVLLSALFSLSVDTSDVITRLAEFIVINHDEHTSNKALLLISVISEKSNIHSQRIVIDILRKLQNDPNYVFLSERIVTVLSKLQVSVSKALSK